MKECHIYNVLLVILTILLLAGETGIAIHKHLCKKSGNYTASVLAITSCGSNSQKNVCCSSGHVQANSCFQTNKDGHAYGKSCNCCDENSIYVCIDADWINPQIKSDIDLLPNVYHFFLTHINTDDPYPIVYTGYINQNKPPPLLLQKTKSSFTQVWRC